LLADAERADWTPDRPIAAQVAALVQVRLEQGWALFQLLEAAVHGEVGLEPYTVPWLWFGAMMAEVERKYRRFYAEARDAPIADNVNRWAERLKDTMKSRL
jgi:hypothetical protein